MVHTFFSNPIWVFTKKNRGNKPKMDGENNGKTLLKLIDDLGGKPPIFGLTPLPLLSKLSLASASPIRPLWQTAGSQANCGKRRLARWRASTELPGGEEKKHRKKTAREKNIFTKLANLFRSSPTTSYSSGKLMQCGVMCCDDGYPGEWF